MVSKNLKTEKKELGVKCDLESPTYEVQDLVLFYQKEHVKILNMYIGTYIYREPFECGPYVCVFIYVHTYLCLCMSQSKLHELDLSCKNTWLF